MQLIPDWPWWIWGIVIVINWYAVAAMVIKRISVKDGWELITNEEEKVYSWLCSPILAFPYLLICTVELVIKLLNPIMSKIIGLMGPRLKSNRDKRG